MIKFVHLRCRAIGRGDLVGFYDLTFCRLQFASGALEEMDQYWDAGKLDGDSSTTQRGAPQCILRLHVQLTCASLARNCALTLLWLGHLFSYSPWGFYQCWQKACLIRWSYISTVFLSATWFPFRIATRPNEVHRNTCWILLIVVWKVQPWISWMRGGLQRRFRRFRRWSNKIMFNRIAGKCIKG